MVYRSDGLSLLLDRPPLHHIALLGQLLLLLFFLFSSLFSSTTPTGRCITGGARQQPVIRLFPSAGNVFLIYILPLIDSIKTPTLLATRQRAVELTFFLFTSTSTSTSISVPSALHCFFSYPLLCEHSAVGSADTARIESTPYRI